MAARIERLRDALIGKSLGVDGGVGAGKTMLCQRLEQVVQNLINIPVIHLVETMRPLLFEYYQSNVKKNAFAVQALMLGKRLIAINAVQQAHEYKKFGLMDRTIRGDYAFMVVHHGDGNIDDNQRAVYEEEAYGTCKQSPLESMTILWLRTSTECQKKHIARRNRPHEIDFYIHQDPRFLDRLEKAHVESMSNVELAPQRIVSLDWNDDKNIDDEACLQLLELVFLPSS